MLKPIKSVVEYEINVPQGKLAELYADPENSKKWMDDLDLKTIHLLAVYYMLL